MNKKEGSSEEINDFLEELLAEQELQITPEWSTEEIYEVLLKMQRVLQDWQFDRIEYQKEIFKATSALNDLVNFFWKLKEGSE